MSIWISPLTLAEIAEFSQPTAPGHIGVVFTEIGPDWLAGSVPLDARTAADDGSLDHGAIAVLVETLASVGATMCSDVRRQACLGQVLHLQHRTPVRHGPVSARARPLWIEPTTQLWEVEVKDFAGALVCVAQLTLAVVDRPPRPPGDRSGPRTPGAP